MSGTAQTLEFQGEAYTLNQCTIDLFEFIDNSKAGEYTRHYDEVVFHRRDGRFTAAYADNLDNHWDI